VESRPAGEIQIDTHAQQMLGSAALSEQLNTRQAALAANFHHNISALLRGEVGDIELRRHQPDIFRDLDDFFTEEVDPQTGRRMILPLPPNAGKSTMAAIVADMANIGKPVAAGQRPLQALTLVPRRVARHQTVKTYRNFTPGIRVQEYDSDRGMANLGEADSTVMTYKAALSMDEADWEVFGGMHDLLVLDEVHRGLGFQTSSRLRRVIDRYRPTVLAMSATPDFDEDRSACKVLGISRTLKKPFTPRDAIDIGASNGVRLYALYSGQELDMSSKRDSVTDRDLAALIENSPRNQLIVDTMHDMAKTGQRGIVQCIPGGAPKKHIQTIAEMARGRKIVDVHTGQSRRMRVEAVGNFRSDTENDNIIEAFRQGRLDALTFSKYLTEAFDNPLDYLIVSPTSSAVDMGQVTGRAARLHGRVTTIFCLIDKYRSHAPKRLWTPFDVFGEECINQGLVLEPPRPTTAGPAAGSGSKPGSGKRPPGQTRNAADPAEQHFSASVRHALEGVASGTVLDEVLLVRAEYPEPPQGYIPLVNLPAIKEGLLTPEGARYALSPLINSADQPLFVSVRTGKYAQYVLPEADRVLRERYVDPTRKVTRIDLDSFLKSQGWPKPSFDIIIKACKVTETNFTISKETMLIEPPDAEKILRYLTQTPLMNPNEELAIADLAGAIGYYGSSLHKVLQRHMDIFEPFVQKRRKGVSPSAYKVVETIKVEAAAKLLSLAIQASKNLTERLGPMNMQELVDAVQLQIRASMWKRKLRPTIDEQAIQDFISQFSPTAPLPEAEAALSAPPLDDSYVLSGYGENWGAHALCADPETDTVFFFSKDLSDIRNAKRLCQKCSVKGDCLAFEMTHPSDEIAGGYTALERQSFQAKGILAWLARQQGQA
jgi:WhiB family redox-sensing transcriptional regulator